jgi:uncharacterized protein YutD
MQVVKETTKITETSHLKGVRIKYGCRWGSTVFVIKHKKKYNQSKQSCLIIFFKDSERQKQATQKIQK